MPVGARTGVAARPAKGDIDDGVLSGWLDVDGIAEEAGCEGAGCEKAVGADAEVAAGGGQSEESHGVRPLYPPHRHP